ncbi:tRNA pseudouridine(55) synthase TruB [Candidatus Parcubacteria bacterium]|nr:MAG: tRNA pseudouridine(55) synthase TruB [Candidatus Parcubacteria bacterium]
MVNADRIIAVAKPVGPTSHDVVDAVRRASGEKTVGHAGTLDPLASGVLVIGIGREATRKLKNIVGAEKEYIATVRLGATSATDDAEGPISEQPAAIAPSEEAVRAVLQQFAGTIEQTPPAFSALKISGMSAHRRARRGEMPVMRPRTVSIYAIELLSYAWPDLRLRILTGPGVYIRALARDLGATLGTGGYLAALERTRVGDFTLDKALALADLAQLR